jgi:hypothetical protein
MAPTTGRSLANGGAVANSGAANAAGNGAGGTGNPGTYGGSGGNPAGRGSGTVADAPAGPTDLGVDISGAGASPTTQLAYFNKLPESQQSSLRMRCVSVEATPVSAVDARQRSFCDTILANR